MQEGKPTPRRVFGTDSSLSYQEQLSHIERGNSMLVTRLVSQIEAATLEELTNISLALTRAQALALKSLGKEDEQEPSDEQLARAIKK